MDWFRSWHGAATDNKWLLIARRAGVSPGIVSAVFWALMDYASQNEADRGSVAGFDAETYAAWAGWSEDDVIAVVEAMTAKGVIDGNSRLSAWDKRQPKRDDDSRERVRKHRGKQQRQPAAAADKGITGDKTDDKSAPNVTQCNADVTQENQKSDIVTPKREEREKRKRSLLSVDNNDNNNDSSSSSSSAPTAPKVSEPQQPEPQTPEPSAPAVAAIDPADWARVRALYEGNFGLLTSLLLVRIQDALRQHPADMVVMAMERAVSANKRRWDYVEGILRNWSEEGYGGSGAKNAAVGTAAESRRTGRSRNTADETSAGRQEAPAPEGLREWLIATGQVPAIQGAD